MTYFDGVKFKTGTAATWTAADPYLQQGEPGFESDTGDIRVGTGEDLWSALHDLEPRSGIIKLAHETLSAAATQIDLTVPDRDDLAGLQIWLRGRDANASAGSIATVRFNGLSTAGDWQEIYSTGTTVAANAAKASTLRAGELPAASAEANQRSTFILDIPFPRRVGGWRTVTSRGGVGYSNTTSQLRCRAMNGWARREYKINTVNLLAGNTFVANTQVLMLGILDR